LSDKDLSYYTVFAEKTDMGLCENSRQTLVISR